MRIRSLFLVALSVVPLALGAQRIPRPRIGRPTGPEPAPLPPQTPEVSRALAYKRSRWSAEAYSMISTMQVPAIGGASMSYTAFGTGTRGDYRFAEHFSATVDLTTSQWWSPASMQTVELGARYWVLDRNASLRPYVDLRAGYLRLYDSFNTATPASSDQGSQFVQEVRYSRGVGSIGGAGFEYGLTRSLAVTTGMSVMRNYMTLYRLESLGTVPDRTSYWMTSVRYTLGLKFNPVRAVAAGRSALGAGR